MAGPAAALRLRLVSDAAAAAPAGLLLGWSAARALLPKLQQRRAHYAALRLLAIREGLVVLAPEDKPLPWSAEGCLFLHQQGPAVLPVRMRLDLPARWHDDVVLRLAAAHAQSLPLLILPGEEDGLRVGGLAGARPLGDVDLPRLAGQAAP